LNYYKDVYFCFLIFYFFIQIFDILLYYFLFIYISVDLKNIIFWGLGIGDWGLGIGDWAQSPIPNPQSPFSPENFEPIYNIILKILN